MNYGQWDSENNKILAISTKDFGDDWYPINKTFKGLDPKTEDSSAALVDGVIVISKININDNTKTLEKLRIQRTVLLENCDWTQLPDSPLTDSKKAEWATYRTNLRNLPATQSSVTNYNDITWPTEPS